MLAQQIMRDGDPKGALTVLLDAVRKDASDVKLRVFLFQLLAVLGQWERALTQLNVAAEMDASVLPMVQTYRPALQCEALRVEVFAGKRSPLIFGDPTPWIAQLVRALGDDTTMPVRAAADRAAAFEVAPTSSGSIDGQKFAWLADADARLGPVLEAIVNGRYFWIPFFRIRRIQCEAPADLRDTVWTPATFLFANDAEAVGLIPTRYAGSAESADAALQLARRTEWDAQGCGLGQRMLVDDSADYALMDSRVIEFDNDLQGEGDG
jgi:type VI secretion system protein ImpE